MGVGEGHGLFGKKTVLPPARRSDVKLDGNSFSNGDSEPLASVLIIAINGCH